MNYEEMKQEVAYIITKKINNHICFLIGDNMTGKTDIGELVQNLDDSILVLDNFNGKYSDLPKDGRILVITHNPWILKNAYCRDKIIMLVKNSIYAITEVEDNFHIDNIFYKLSKKDDLTFLLARLLNNAVDGCWSKLNNEYLEYYKKNKRNIEKTDILIFDEIEKWKKINGCLY